MSRQVDAEKLQQEMVVPSLQTYRMADNYRIIYTM